MCTGSSFRYRTESRSTEDTWQRTTGSSCRPHESTTGDAGVSLTRSLSDSGPVPISLAVRALLHLKHYARRLHGDADIIRFARGRRASGSPPCGLRVRRRRRWWGKSEPTVHAEAPQLVGRGDMALCASSIGSVTRCTRQCRGYSSGRRSNWCSMRPCTARLPQRQPNEAQSECLTRPE